MSYLLPSSYTGLYNSTTTTSYTVPVLGESRYDVTRQCMETWDGKQWVQVTSVSLTPQELVEQCIDQVETELEEFGDNPTVQDALESWREATEKLQVIVALSRKNT